MAKIKKPVTLKYQLTVDAEIHEATFAPGDPIQVVATWPQSLLVKGSDGHYYNVKKDKIES